MLMVLTLTFHGFKLRNSPSSRALSPTLCDTPETRLSEYQRLQDDLAGAIAAEDYALAAKLRDQLSSSVMDDQMAILACNTEFYAAFAAGDFARMDGVWASDEVACIHPGMPPLY